MFRVAFGTAVLMCAICSSSSGGQEKPISNATSDEEFAEFHIGPGDVLQISVYQHPDLSRTVVVNPDGNICLPPLNALKVAGMSVHGVADLLRSKLEPMLAKPKVTVAVTEIHHEPVHRGLFMFTPPRRVPPIRDVAPPDRMGCCVAKSNAPKMPAS